MAGFQVRFAVEKDKSAARTYRYNHPNTLVLEDDIHNINPRDYLLPNEHVSIVFGGPPCQDYSIAGKREMGHRANLTIVFAQIVSKIKPLWVVFENVYKEGALTVNVIDRNGVSIDYQVVRENNNIIITFEPLEEVATVSINIQ